MKFRIEVAILYPNFTWENTYRDIQTSNLKDAKIRVKKDIVDALEKENVEISGVTVLGYDIDPD